TGAVLRPQRGSISRGRSDADAGASGGDSATVVGTAPDAWKLEPEISITEEPKNQGAAGRFPLVLWLFGSLVLGSCLHPPGVGQRRGCGVARVIRRRLLFRRCRVQRKLSRR